MLNKAFFLIFVFGVLLATPFYSFAQDMPGMNMLDSVEGENQIEHGHVIDTRHFHVSPIEKFINFPIATLIQIINLIISIIVFIVLFVVSRRFEGAMRMVFSRVRLSIAVFALSFLSNIMIDIFGLATMMTMMVIHATIMIVALLILLLAALKAKEIEI